MTENNVMLQKVNQFQDIGIVSRKEIYYIYDHLENGSLQETILEISFMLFDSRQNGASVYDCYYWAIRVMTDLYEWDVYINR